MLSVDKIRELLASHGELRPQTRDRWCGTIPLPEVVAEFYEKIGPWGPTIHQEVLVRPAARFRPTATRSAYRRFTGYGTTKRATAGMEARASG